MPPAEDLRRFLQISTRKARAAIMIVGQPLVAFQEDEGTEGLVRWRARPELDRSDLSTLQGRTQAQAPCQREKFPW